jgi:hypothetical protein
MSTCDASLTGPPSAPSSRACTPSLSCTRPGCCPRTSGGPSAAAMKGTIGMQVNHCAAPSRPALSPALRPPVAPLGPPAFAAQENLAPTKSCPLTPCPAGCCCPQATGGTPWSRLQTTRKLTRTLMPTCRVGRRRLMASGRRLAGSCRACGTYSGSFGCSLSGWSGRWGRPKR